MAHAPAPLSPEEVSRSHRVVERLAEAADPTGFVPFDRFMEIALYAEGLGFYHRERSPLGTAGDFYTAAHVHPLFAEALAARLREIRGATGDARPFTVVELGPGDGTLAAGVVRALAGDSIGLDYVLVERSTSRAAEAEARIRAASETTSVRRVESLGALGPFAGAVVANEFLDAQPARRLRWTGGEWREVGVRVDGGRLASAERPLVRPVPGPPLPAPVEPGAIVEVSPAAEATVRELADHLVAGGAVLIDYGFEAAELVRGHSAGTVAAVRDHRFLSDPLESPGTADLSAFVNFTRVLEVARAGGLTEVAYRSQAEALGAWGFPALLDAAVRAAGSAEAEVRVRLAAKNLLFGFDRFRVLELAARDSAPALARAT